MNLFLQIKALLPTNPVLRINPVLQLYLINTCRFLAGAVFAFSGFVKAIDPVGQAIKVEEYLNAFGLAQFQWGSLMFAFCLCALEFMLGVCLLLGVYRRFTTFLALLFMVFMTPLTFYLALFNPVSDCGCFGDALVLTNWQSFGKNVALLAIAIYIYVYNRKIYPFYTCKTYWFVALFACLACMGFSYFNYLHLPIIDFRPYKVGANIPALMTIPEGAPQDEYRYSFIYEKNRLRRMFTLEEAPVNDSSWVFIESKTKLLKRGYVPPVTSFNLYDKAGHDVTDYVLQHPKGVFLLIAPQLEKADDVRMDEINNLYDYAGENGLAFFCLTASPQEAVQRWIDHTGAAYPVLQADGAMLQTIIRSNPGLVLLKEGVILAKWHYNDIPSEPTLTANTSAAGDNPLPLYLFFFTLPLALVWIHDYFRYRPKKVKQCNHLNKIS